MPLRLLSVCCGCFLATLAVVLGNGGAWQIGVPSTGNAAASDKGRTTNVVLEEENLTIDLHQEFAAVEVRYRMHNAGPKLAQDFFFPVERWSPAEGEEEGSKPADLENYHITADGAELKWKDLDAPSPKKPEETPAPTAPSPEPSATDEEQPIEPTEAIAEEFPPATKHWKKSEIQFGANQVREIVIRYRAGYSGYESSVSDDGHGSDHVLAYSLSPAATWKGSIGRGKIVINVLHPIPEEVVIEKPTGRFKKISDLRYQWEFTDLEPTLDDDLKIVAHRAYHSYAARNAATDVGSDGEEPIARDYVVEGDHYFLLHADYEPVASSTLPSSEKRNYDVANIKKAYSELPWSEGAEGDGIGESITLNVTRPLPLEAIMIVPGYRNSENPALWTKNNRVAELEVTLNGEKTFTAKIPDEHFMQPYPLPVRDYAAAVKTIKLVIKGVHRGTAAHDTCISEVRLKAKLVQKPEIQPAR